MATHLKAARITKATQTALDNRGRRSEIESELETKYHVQFQYRSGVPITEFNLKASLTNQARFEAIDQKTVALYATAMERGDIFPAVLAWRPKTGGSLVIVDGNHRLSASIRADKAMDVYEIDPTTDPRTIALMTFSFNTRHGMPTTEAERIHQAIYLTENGASIGAAAGAVNIGESVLKRALLKNAADKRADMVGLRRPEWDSLAATVKNRLVNIHTDEGFMAAADLAYKAKLNADEAFKLVGLMNASHSAVQQREIVAHQVEIMRERIQNGGIFSSADRKKMTPKGRTNLAISQLMALPEDDQAIVASYAVPEREDAAKRMLDSGHRLIHLAELLLA